MKPFFLVFLFAAAFGYLEAAIVIYIRALFFPDGFAFPLPPTLLDKFVIIEIGREFCTMVMLLAVGGLASSKRWSRFAFFIFAFGIWDIFYYIWLKVLIDWPESFFTWDILFLIPNIWVGPVLSPLIVAFSMCFGGLIIAWQEVQGFDFEPKIIHWIGWIVAVAIIFGSYVIDYGAIPTGYRWELLAAGEIIGFITFFDVIRRGW